MSEVIDEGAFQGRGAVEAKLAEAGADQIRRHSFEEAPESAPEGTPEETVSADQPRNDLGQFASTEQPEETAPVEDQAAEEVPAQSGEDPAVAAFLAKYGGDVNKAIAGAVHLQRKAGEQSNELGDLRRMVDELAQMRELQQADFQQRQQNQPIDQGTVDWFDQQFMAGPNEAAQAVEWARQQGNNILFQRGLASWKDVDPYAAAVYTNNLSNAQLRAEMEQVRREASQLPTDSAVHMALSNVRAENPQFVNYDDKLDATFQKHPFVAEALNTAVASGNRQQIEGVIKTAYSLAVGDTLANLALTGETPEPATAQDVVAPTTSETHEPPAPPSKLDQFREEFRQVAEREQKGIWVAE